MKEMLLLLVLAFSPKPALAAERGVLNHMLDCLLESAYHCDSLMASQYNQRSKQVEDDRIRAAAAPRLLEPIRRAPASPPASNTKIVNVLACDAALNEATGKSANIARQTDNRNLLAMRSSSTEYFLFLKENEGDPDGRLFRLQLPVMGTMEDPYFFDLQLGQKNYCLVYRYRMLRSDLIEGFSEGACSALRVARFANTKGPILQPTVSVLVGAQRIASFNLLRERIDYWVRFYDHRLDEKSCNFPMQLLAKSPTAGACAQFPEMQALSQRVDRLLQRVVASCDARGNWIAPSDPLATPAVPVGAMPGR